VKDGISPAEDLGKRYFTSGVFKSDFKLDPNDFEVKLRWTFDNIEDALLWESRVNSRIIHRETWANIAVGKGCRDIEKLKVRREEACVKKYGVPHNMMVREIRDKRDETLVRLFGTKNISSLDIIKDKVKQTCLRKFGTEYSFQSPSVKSKIKKSLIERYGVSNPALCPAISKKKMDSNIKKYGMHYFKTKEFLELNKIKRDDMYIKLAKMDIISFTQYLSTLSQHKSIQNQKKTQREIGVKLLETINA
jgi:hypothetical protein